MKFIKRIKPTPVRLFSVVLILLGLVTTQIYPITHFALETSMTPIIIWLTRGFFLFCGFFGILGNGRTKAFRAIMVGMPLIYTGLLYAMLFWHSDSVINPILGTCLFTILGLWTMLLGRNYE